MSGTLSTPPIPPLNLQKTKKSSPPKKIQSSESPPKKKGDKKKDTEEDLAGFDVLPDLNEPVKLEAEGLHSNVTNTSAGASGLGEGVPTVSVPTSDDLQRQAKLSHWTREGDIDALGAKHQQELDVLQERHMEAINNICLDYQSKLETLQARWDQDADKLFLVESKLEATEEALESELLRKQEEKVGVFTKTPREMSGMKQMNRILQAQIAALQQKVLDLESTTDLPPDPDEETGLSGREEAQEEGGEEGGEEGSTVCRHCGQARVHPEEINDSDDSKDALNDVHRDRQLERQRIQEEHKKVLEKLQADTDREIYSEYQLRLLAEEVVLALKARLQSHGISCELHKTVSPATTVGAEEKKAKEGKDGWFDGVSRLKRFWKKSDKEKVEAQLVVL
eukprot:Platyproteum_vivax@DN5216_c0_g1_i1.p1